MSENKPCPKCGNEIAKTVSFTWWGGFLGPKLLNHVKCGACFTNYNGKTGASNTKGIVIYSLVVGILTIVLVFGTAMILVFGAMN